jgi:hypothetical protein
MVFGAGEYVMMKGTLDEAHKYARDAKLAFAGCVMRCARKYGKYDEAHEFWEIYGKR